MAAPFPPGFEKTTLDLYSEQGRAWIDHFPALIARLEARWDIHVLPPYELSYNFVAPAERPDGSPVVLKLGVPNPEMMSEMASLRHFAGRGIVQLLESDPQEGAMLLECLTPGLPLADFAADLLHGDWVSGDMVATRIAAQVMQELWMPAPRDPALITAEGWMNGLRRLRQTFGGTTGPFPEALVDRAERINADLIASTGPPMLLHGDLHHWNILSAQRSPWLALDPKGVIGEVEYEIAPWMINQWPANANHDDLRRQADRRIHIFCEMLGLERSRLLDHTIARSILSGWWSFEDHHEVNTPIFEFAEVIAGMS